jgi:hypothetical protein
MVQSFLEEFGNDIEFVLVTDAGQQEIHELLERCSPITTFDQELTEVSDMLLLAGCDVIITSRWAKCPRGIAVKQGERLPAIFVKSLISELSASNDVTDLSRYGAVMAPATGRVKHEL